MLSKIKYLWKKLILKHQRLTSKFLSRLYSEYDSEEFKKGLESIGIEPGDSVFVMLSVDKVLLSTGHRIPVNVLLNDLIEYLTDEGTLMVLGFSVNRANIINGEKIFDLKKTATQSGILAEILRRKKGTSRSIHPFLSAIAYGKNADKYCNSHQESPYPFDKTSPYYRIMENGGKYLGIGVGFEAFTPCHMIDDYYKQDFKHNIYYDAPQLFTIIDYSGNYKQVECFVRNENTYPSLYDPHYYFKLLDVPHVNLTLPNSGISLFSFEMKTFFKAAINLYDRKKITVWDTHSPSFLVKRIFYNLAKWIINITGKQLGIM
ncbi:MAG: AAC(3) family N-acetyltransferase [Syntrophomonas sp.]